MILTPECLADFTSHVLAEHPREACGFVVDDTFIAVPNTAEKPLLTFRISAKDHLFAASKGKIQAILHSHPYDMNVATKWPPEWPTTHDMQSWMNGSVPWGIVGTEGYGLTPIVWLDDNEIAPLIGRDFIHGIHDCYSLIRDWFKLEKNIIIPNFARGIEWWVSGQDLYGENFALAGFEEINPQDATIGDCVMMQVMSPVLNHAAVITGDNEILHHLFHRLSGRDRLDRWESKVEKVVRYTGDKK